MCEICSKLTMKTPERHHGRRVAVFIVTFETILAGKFRMLICDALCDLVPFIQIKKRAKHPWRSVNFSCNFTKINTPPWVFFTFFKLYKWCQIAQRTTYVILCAIWYHLYNLKNMKNTHKGVIHGCIHVF